MLEIHDLTLQLGDAPEASVLLSEITVALPTKGHFTAILGPSGCGKSTLLKVIAGLREPTSGQLRWEDRDLAEEGDLEPYEIGYVPQFGVTYDLLTVRECIDDALRLRVAGLGQELAKYRIDEIVRDVGLAEIAERRVQVLSGGQKRRLALAMEMVSEPKLLLCDEVTSGLDPKAEDEIAHLLHQLSRKAERLVLSVTHSLRHLSLCDSVLVLYQGHLVYHGAPEHLFHYFGVGTPEELFPRLVARRATDWHHSWIKHRPEYYLHAGLKNDETAPGKTRERTAANDARVIVAPSGWSQFSTLLERRWRLFLRDRGQLLLQAALIFGFPCLVVIFALDGLPQIKSLAEVPGANFIQQLQSDFARRSDMMRTGSLVSGLVMFQVILLALMGANNGAREIAGERPIFEKEKFAGVGAAPYLFSKATFLGVLVIVQSVWMAMFVHWIVQFPGNLGDQMLLLTLVNAAVTSACLAISSWMRTAEQASLVSIYLVGFQLPLSGAVLALPLILNGMTRWFVASYWGWSGYLQTLRDTRFYGAAQQVTYTKLTEVPLCALVLICHVLLGLYLAITGCRNSRWE